MKHPSLYATELVDIFGSDINAAKKALLEAYRDKIYVGMNHQYVIDVFMYLDQFAKNM